MSNDFRAIRLSRAVALLSDLQRATIRLHDALEQPESEFIRDAAIQRFEFSFELAWKSIQSIAALEGLECRSPRSAFETAWQNKWISNQETWIDMIDQRNKTSHTYHEATAQEVFASLPDFLVTFQELHRALRDRLSQIESEDRK